MCVDVKSLIRGNGVIHERGMSYRPPEDGGTRVCDAQIAGTGMAGPERAGSGLAGTEPGGRDVAGSALGDTELADAELGDTEIIDARAVAAAHAPQAPSFSPVLPGRHHLSGTGLTAQDSAKYLGLELRALSEDSITSFSAEGPVLAPRSRPAARLRSTTFVDALSRRDQVLITFLSGVWLACLVVFWQWWLEPAHRIGMFGLVANSVILAYVSGFPAVFVLAANR